MTSPSLAVPIATAGVRRAVIPAAAAPAAGSWITPPGMTTPGCRRSIRTVRRVPLAIARTAGGGVGRPGPTTRRGPGSRRRRRFPGPR